MWRRLPPNRPFPETLRLRPGPVDARRAASSPRQEPAPAAIGHNTRRTPSLRAISAACTGPAPPVATMVKRRGWRTFSAMCILAAPAIVSLTILAMPQAVAVSRATGDPPSRRTRSRPRTHPAPCGRRGSTRRRDSRASRSASVTVALFRRCHSRPAPAPRRHCPARPSAGRDR